MWVAPTFENGCIELCVSLCFLLCLHFCIHFFVCYCSSIAVFMHIQRASLQLSSVPFDKNRQKTNHQTDINKPIWPSIMWGKKRKYKQITQFDGESPSWPPLPRLLIFIEMNQQTNVNKNMWICKQTTKSEGESPSWPPCSWPAGPKSQRPPSYCWRREQILIFSPFKYADHDDDEEEEEENLRG